MQVYCHFLPTKMVLLTYVLSNSIPNDKYHIMNKQLISIGNSYVRYGMTTSNYTRNIV